MNNSLYITSFKYCIKLSLKLQIITTSNLKLFCMHCYNLKSIKFIHYLKLHNGN